MQVFVHQLGGWVESKPDSRMFWPTTQPNPSNFLEGLSQRVVIYSYLKEIFAQLKLTNPKSLCIYLKWIQIFLGKNLDLNWTRNHIG